MGLTAHRARAVFDGQTVRQALLVIRGGRVEALADRVPEGATVVDHGDTILAPGFVDLQVNGGGGVMLNDDPTPAGLRRISRAHAQLGATTILPTLITDTPDTTAAAIAAVADAVAEGVAGIAGLHLEGPHLAGAKKGAHDGALIRPMDAVDLAALCDAAATLPALMVTLAPEAATPRQIAALAEAGAIVSLGHSDADHDTAIAAADAGARCVTHLFNAMSGLGHRAPGLVGAALTDPRLSAGLIADGVHVHPAAMTVALRARPGGLFLVTDAMAVAGTDETGFTLNGRRIHRRGGRLTLEDGTLAGADLTMAQALSNIIALGTDPAEALAMATARPAGLMGLNAGRLAPGAPADFVKLGADWTLRGTWRNGARVDPDGPAV